MAESNQNSRKKMRFSSPSATKILTTKNNPQNQRDHHRSAPIAPAVSQIGNGSRIIGKKKIDTKIIRTCPRVTIKDLRLRRVFSPSSISTTDWRLKVKEENQTKEKDGIKANVVGLENAEAEEFLQTTPSEEINGLNVKKTKSVLHPCSRGKIYKNPGSFSYKRLLPYLMQAAEDGKSLSQNPSNVDLSCDKVIGETAEDPKEEVSEVIKANSQLPEITKPVSQSVDSKHSDGSLCEKTNLLKTVIASSPNKKPALSRRKLFITPGSLNYRRMLPYLRDIQEDHSCVPETVQQQDHQKNTEENTPSSMLVSENERTQDLVTRELEICFNENKESLPCERVSLSPERSDLDKEQETQVKHVIPDTEKNLGTPHNVLDSEIPLLSSPLVGSRSSSEVASSALHNMFADNLAGEEIMNGEEKIEAKQLEANSPDLTAELLDSSVLLVTPPSVSPSKGILKRSIRGCRGICSCLNCSSFRLNAERAFEFSRNQLQDTEVMVLDLVGEISHLRDMLEKYSSADHNESYKSQAGEAAKRACEAAELAKSRLHQMNDDLQVHCRIPDEQRARVKFAHYVHEKTMNITD